MNMTQQGTPIQFEEILEGDLIKVWFSEDGEDYIQMRVAHVGERYVKAETAFAVRKGNQRIELLDHPVKLPTGEGALLTPPSGLQAPAILRGGVWYFIISDGTTERVKFPESLIREYRYSVVYEGRTE